MCKRVIVWMEHAEATPILYGILIRLYQAMYL